MGILAMNEFNWEMKEISFFSHSIFLQTEAIFFHKRVTGSQLHQNI